MCAFLNTTGFLMLAISIVIGYAGPANALNSIQAIILTLLSASILHQKPSDIEVIGMMFGIFGTIMVAIGNEIYKALSNCFLERQL